MSYKIPRNKGDFIRNIVILRLHRKKDVFVFTGLYAIRKVRKRNRAATRGTENKETRG